MKRLVLGICFLLITASVFSQDLNSYKYAVIPYQFVFTKKHDQYRVNTLVRHLFKKEGFIPIYDNEQFPEDLTQNRCLGLYVDVNNDSNMFATKMNFILRNCSNEVIMESAVGRSKIKAYDKAYNQALRSAFRSIEGKNYKYDASLQAATPIVKEIAVVEEVASTKKAAEEAVAFVKEVPTEEKKTKGGTSPQNTPKVTKENIGKLYAKSIGLGYQLVDANSKEVMVLLLTPKKDIYIVKGADAIVYKEGDLWIYSKSTGKKIKAEAIDVKF